MCVAKTKWRPVTRITRFCVSCALYFGVFLSCLTVGCDLPGRPNPADRPVPADQVLEFGVLYRQNSPGAMALRENSVLRLR